MQIRRIGFVIPIIFFITASPIYTLLKTSGFDSTAALMVEGALVGIGIGWLSCFILVMKYLPK